MNGCQSSSVVINGLTIWYEKFGSGSKIVLLIPDAIDTGRTGFSLFLEGQYAIDLDQFTVIAVELPGWGRSRPPERQLGANTYDKDCEVIHSVMKQLGYERFAVIGHSEGAKVAALIAIKHSDDILALVLSGISIANKEYAIKHINSTKNIDRWDEDRVELLLGVYQTHQQIQELWNNYCKFYGCYAQYFSNVFCNYQYKNIKCKTIVLHGDQDPLTDLDQASHVAKSINKAKLHSFPYGKHDFHSRSPKLFKDTVQDFLTKVMTEEEDKLNAFNDICG